MKSRCLVVGLVFVLELGLTGCKKESGATEENEETMEAARATPVSLTDVTVEVGCAMCIYKKEGVMACEPAAKVDGQTVMLKGTDFNVHTSGLCEHAKMAKVTGEGKGGEMTVTKLEWVEP